MSVDAAAMAKLQELLSAVKAMPDPRRATNEWKQVFKLLQPSGLPAGRINGVVGMRDVAGLEALLASLAAPAGPPADDAPDADTLRKALHAFRKRMSLTVLDEESKLGRGPLSKGAVDASQRAITPPADWPAEVWQELVRQGRLHYIGHGFYELPRTPAE
jgi:hypothetical protein